MSPFPTQVLLELDGSPIAAVVVVAAITVSGAVLYYASSKAFSAFVHRMFEKQLSKAVNCTRVTCGCCELSLLDGTFEARDIVCHTPHREEWKWDSPLIGRCGYMRVRFSFLSCVPFGQRFLRYPAKEVYSVLVCDMQVFVEKRANVFNYMLLDPSLDLPDPNTLEEHGSRSGNVEAPMTETAFGSNNLDKDDSPTKKSPGLDKAGSIMRSFMGTLSRASKAGNEPGHGGIERVIKDQGKSLYSAVKQVQRQVEDGDKSFEDVTREGMAVMKKVQKGFASNMEEIKEKMNTFSNPPPKRAGWKPKPAKDLFRIGSVVMRDLRVFTRNMIAKDERVSSPAAANPKGWHKPILFKEVVVSGAELSCPPMRLDANGSPRIGLHINEISRVMQKKMVAETGKTNGTTLLQNAFGEVSEYFSAAAAKTKKV
ncbi:hypothetical protein TrST_g14283 [Triparma strigata]|uniref:Uncharacterized protein n=1 Tax=Triparma strigata TaxID=1606541 RepID=A0A9W7CCM9_9STRA|nr:hypothetical protein TrST_g14283 [Triparma strigata]